mgnify:CR=1 FL=1
MKKNALKKELDWFSMLVPLAIVLAICALFVIFPEESKFVLSVCFCKGRIQCCFAV